MAGPWATPCVAPRVLDATQSCAVSRFHRFDVFAHDGRFLGHCDFL
uniref:Uncharacterized protein n=1 Tax=Arundo donax TaxID=35708 RepID=A0A0A9FF95_ARUDO